MIISDREIKEYDNIIVGAGAGGLVVAKLISHSHPNDNSLLYEQHDAPGGCGGYFSRGNPKRVYDAGATQLVSLNDGEIQNKIFSLGCSETEKKLTFQKIENIFFHFPDDNSLISIDSNSKVKLLKGFISSKELSILRRIFYVSTKMSIPLWRALEQIPKFPIQSIKEFIHDIKLIFKMKNKLFILISFLFSFEIVSKLLGLKSNFLKTKQIINSLLLDTVQNHMKNVPWVLGSMGLSILGFGIYRLEGGMRSYFYNLSLQVQKKGLKIHYKHELKKIKICKEGFLLTIYDGKNKKISDVLVRKNLYLNLTIWNVLKVFDEKNGFTKKIQKKSLNDQTWGACALYGFFENQDDYPKSPWYHQIFSNSDEIVELNSSIYLSIYQEEHDTKIRNFTATIHFNISSYCFEKKDIYHKKILERIEKSLLIKIIKSEFASPQTFEKYTLRDRGQVGGIITNSFNMFFNPTPSSYLHPNKSSKLFLVGDTVFPGQGIISSSLSGIIAWERSTGLKFSELN